MLNVEQILEIKQLRAQGVPIRRIAKQLGMSRNAVRRYLRGATPGEYSLEKPRRQLVRERIDARVRELLKSEQDKATPRKQRLTATRIHRILMGEGKLASERTVRKAIREHIVRMAKDNARWGDARIQGELRKLGHEVARSTIAKTLQDHGVPPSTERPTNWRTFLKAHAGVIAAMDFFTVEVWTARGLVTHHVLFVLHHASRMVEIAGVTTNPDGEFMAQVARTLTDGVDGFLSNKQFLILDRDSKFTAQFRRILRDAGVEVVTTAFHAPNMNALAERFVQSVKRECLERLILFGPDHLQRALNEFVAHYHLERPHQGLGNRVLTASPSEPPIDGDVVVDERLGGLLRSYRRVA